MATANLPATRNGTGQGAAKPSTGTRWPELFAALAADFGEGEVKSLAKGGRKFWYVTARTVMNRLDSVLGPENWWDDYVPAQDSTMCRLTIRLPDGSTITKCDAGGAAGMADAGDDDKSMFSDAFKRAAARFGVGRLLYGDGVPEYPKAVLPEGGTPATDKAFREWAMGYAAKVNEHFRDLLAEVGEKAEGRELVREFQLTGHLHKWALAARLYPDRDNGEWNHNHRLRALGVAFRDHQAEVKAEAKAYVGKLKEEAMSKAGDRRDPAPIGDDDGDPPAPWDDDPDRGQDADS